MPNKGPHVAISLQEYNRMILELDQLRSACTRALDQLTASEGYKPCLGSAKRILREAIKLKESHK